MNGTRTFVDEWTEHLQRDLSQLSVQWLMSWAAELELQQEIDLWAKPFVLEELLYQGDGARWALPSFGTLEVILKHARWISQLPFLFALTVVSEKGDFSRYEWLQAEDKKWKFTTSPDDKSSCLVIRAVSLNTSAITNVAYSNFVVERLKEIGFETVLLWVNADHPQYSGRKLNGFAENPFGENGKSLSCEGFRNYQNHYENYKKMARRSGCTLMSPQFLYMKHFSSDQLVFVKENATTLPPFLYRFFQKELIPFFAF
jgi:hypothetical protein